MRVRSNAHENLGLSDHLQQGSLSVTLIRDAILKILDGIESIFTPGSKMFFLFAERPIFVKANLAELIFSLKTIVTQRLVDNN